MKQLKLSILLFTGFIAAQITTSFAQVTQAEIDSIYFYMPKIQVTANRYEKNLIDTNIPVQVIDRHEIWQKGYTNINDLVELEPGVSKVEVGPWSQKLVIRGLVGPQVLTLVDGMRLEVLRGYGNHAPMIDVDQIERVEIIRGPASVMYGSEAIAGVVNYITQKPNFESERFRLNSDIGLQYSSINNQHTETLKLHGGLSKWSFIVGLTNRSADDVDTPEGTLANTAFNGYTIDSKIGFSPSGNHELFLSTQFNRFTDVGVPTSQYARDAKFVKYYRDLYSLSYNYKAVNQILSSAKISAYYQTGVRNFSAFMENVPKGAAFVRQKLDANRDVDNWGVNAQSSFALLKNNFVTVGIDAFAEYDDTRRIADAEVYNAAGIILKNPPADLTPPTPKSDRLGYGLFIEDEFAASSRLSLNLGARYDLVNSHADATSGTLVLTNRDESDTDFSGNFGALYRVHQSIHLMANIGRAFKAPTLQERYFMGTAQVGYLYGNPELNSESSLNLDTGIKWDAGKFTGEVNVFRNQIDDLIVMNPISAAADTFRYDNVGEALLYGFEFQSLYKITNELSISLTSSYVHGQNTKTDEPLPQIPPLDGSVSLRYEAQNKMYWVELTGRFVDQQTRVAENEPETDGYNLLHVSSGLNLSRIIGFTQPLYLTLNIRNALDETYRDHLSSVNWWYAPGRSIIVGLKTNF
ncbi:TonB-dependent receptor [candidate division KSB1 bacterium]|nr:TonB-dependent receptor [candidate division KSB1 bacterium]